jgi:hypothetical protein
MGAGRCENIVHPANNNNNKLHLVGMHIRWDEGDNARAGEYMFFCEKERTGFLYGV